MIPMLLALAFQAALEEGPTVPLPCADPMLITASRTGKFVVVAEAKKVHVLDGETLKPVRQIDFECTAVGFDAKDETLTVVAAQAVRFETKDWKEAFRADLPEVELKKPGQAVGRIIVDLRQMDPPDGWVAGQAMVAADGTIYYRSKGARLMAAKELERKFVGEQLLDEPDEDRVFSKVDSVLAVPPGPVLVRLGFVTGVVLKRKAYTLAFSSDPLAVGLKGVEVPVVTRKALCVYHSVSWKNLGVVGKLEGIEENGAAVFDGKRGRFFIAREAGLLLWDGGKGSDVTSIEGVFGRIRGLAIDGAATRLYGVEKDKLRSWRLKD